VTKATKVQKKRIQLDMDPFEVEQLISLQRDTGSASYAETFRALLDLGILVRDEVLAEKEALDLKAVRQLMFSRASYVLND